jgi:metal-sulfur cluster biosynthetic enzyme
MAAMVTEKAVFGRLKTVIDPELHVDIVSLGLIYTVRIEQNIVTVTMTLTTPGCPLAPIIDRMIQEALQPLGFEKVAVELVWDPPWTKDKMSEEAQLRLGMI